MGGGTIIPAWLGLLIGGPMMLIVAGHLISLQSDTGPSSRRRIRQVNGALMLLLIPLLTAGFALINHQTHPGQWVLVWLAAMFLLAFVVFFAVLDALNTVRIRRAARERARARLRVAREELARRSRERQHSHTEASEADA